MPDDLKQVVDSVSGEYGRTLFKAFWEKKRYESLNTWVSDMGGTLHVLSDADYAEADRLTGARHAGMDRHRDRCRAPGKAIEAKFRELETLRQAVEPVPLHRHRRQEVTRPQGTGRSSGSAPRASCHGGCSQTRLLQQGNEVWKARIPTEQVFSTGPRPRCSGGKPLQMAQRGGHGRLHAHGVLTFVDVFLRYWFGKSINGTVEITELMMVIVVFSPSPTRNGRKAASLWIS